MIKSKLSIFKAFGSALLLVSALAVFTPKSYGKDKKEAEKEKQEQAYLDSIFTARYVFQELKASSLEILPLQTRLDMLDYWDVDSVYKASNKMEGLSWLETVTPDYLKVKITPVSTLEIKILPEKKTKLAMTIYTVGDDVQAQDSEVKFYDENMTEVPTDKHFKLPQVKDFFEIPKGSATKMKEIEDMIPFPTIALSANPDNDFLDARLTVEQYINEDDWNIAKLFLKPQVKYEWKKDKYELWKEK